jgi:hypothetical protein
MPGYVSHKAFIADDGERLTLFEWESARPRATGRPVPSTWPSRRKFYEEYRLQVCETLRGSTFTRPA